MGNKMGRLRRFLFGKFVGAMLIVLGIALAGCMLGLVLCGWCSGSDVTGAGSGLHA